MADDVLKSFVISLGWKVDREGERRVTEAIGSVTKQAALLATALGAAALAATAAVAKIVAQFDNLYFVSQRTGATVQNIKGLAYAFGQVGGSGAGAVSAIESFSRSMRTNPGIRQFVRDLGVATEAGGKTRDSVDVLTDAIDAIQKKHPYYVGAQMASLLGIDEQTFNTLSTYRKEIKEFRAEYERTARTVGLNNDAAAAASNRFMTALRGLQASAQAVAEKILTDLSPVLTKFLEDIRAWIEKNPETIKKAIDAIVAAAIALVTAFRDIATALTPVAQGFQSIAESLTGKEGLEAAMTAFAAFLVGTWLVKILGAFGAVSTGWVGLLATLGLAKGANANGILKPSEHGATLEGFIDNLDPGLRRLIYGPTEQQKADQGKPGLLRRMWEGGKKMLGIGGGAGDTSGGTAARRGRGDNVAGARESYDFWRSKGLTHEQAAGLVGMEQGESQFNPRAVGDGGRAHGAFQHHPDRRAKILRGTGIDISSATHQQQLEATYWEMTQGQEKAFWGRIKQAKTPGEAAALGVHLFERPADKVGEARLRGQYANRWAEQFKDGPKASPPAPPAAPKMNIAPGLTAQGFNDRFGAAPPMGSVSNSSSVDNRSVRIEHKTDVNINGAGDPATTAERLKQTLSRGSELSLRNAQTAIR